MEFHDWAPAYRAVLATFGYGRAGDERARDELAARTTGFDLSRLDHIRDATVAVAGAGQGLERAARRAAEADAVLAASTAADRLADVGVDVDCVVTDLDKHAGRVRAFTAREVPVAVHAHGDNRDLLAQHVPRLVDEHVLPTTQAAPLGPVRNFGGFTDGDRAAFLADHLGAAELRFVGWTLDDRTVGAEKARKLAWAERLLYWLERRRGERFGLLDGRRNRIRPLP
jgi:uncharacterized Rossmann fold enzyme